MLITKPNRPSLALCYKCLVLYYDKIKIYIKININTSIFVDNYK